MKRNRFERLFIVRQKLWAGVRPLIFQESLSTVGFSSNHWTWETMGLPKLNEGTLWLLKRQGRVIRRQTRIVMIWPNEVEPLGEQAEDMKILIFSWGVKKQDFEGLLWGPIDPIGIIRVEKDWAYGPISSPRIRAYSRTINKGRNENCLIGRGKEYLWRT